MNAAFYSLSLAWVWIYTGKSRPGTWTGNGGRRLSLRDHQGVMESRDREARSGQGSGVLEFEWYTISNSGQQTQLRSSFQRTLCHGAMGVLVAGGYEAGGLAENLQ